MKNKKIGILCAFCVTSFGTIEAMPWVELEAFLAEHNSEAIPWTNLEAFLAERSFSWTEELKNHVKNIRKSANYLSKTEKTGPWDGVKEVLKKYPFLETMLGTPPRISLQNGMFFGTEKEWREEHQRQLRQRLSYLKYFSERLLQETNLLIHLVQTIGDADDVESYPLNRIEEVWRDVRITVYGSSYEPILSGESDFRARRQRREHEELRWRQEGQDEIGFQKFKWTGDGMTEANVAQLLRQNGFSDEVSVSHLAADIENIMQKYSGEVSSLTSVPVFTEDLE
ncbi:MAG: hypothetical protein LBD40_02805 [Puniceicoccales bacterium]|nr:hypothetical protein [Puniceicoccales bacterium]